MVKLTGDDLCIPRTKRKGYPCHDITWKTKGLVNVCMHVRSMIAANFYFSRANCRYIQYIQILLINRFWKMLRSTILITEKSTGKSGINCIRNRMHGNHYYNDFLHCWYKCIIRLNLNLGKIHCCHVLDGLCISRLWSASSFHDTHTIVKKKMKGLLYINCLSNSHSATQL